MAKAIGAWRHLDERNTSVHKWSLLGVRCYSILLSGFPCLKSATKCNYAVDIWFRQKDWFHAHFDMLTAAASRIVANWKITAVPPVFTSGSINRCHVTLVDRRENAG